MANISIHKHTPAKKDEETTASVETAPRGVALWDPFRAMRRFLEWDPFRAMAPMPELPELSAAFDIKETPDRYTFVADVPGIERNDLDVSLTANRLTVRGKRESKKEEKGEHMYSCERSYGSFVRSFTLPEDSDLERIEADRTDGVLTITVHKKPGAATKKIDVGGKKPS